MVSSQQRPNNTPLYSIHSNLHSFILYNEEDIDEKLNEIETDPDMPQHSNQALHEELNSLVSSSPVQQQHDGKVELNFLQTENKISKPKPSLESEQGCSHEEQTS